MLDVRLDSENISDISVKNTAKKKKKKKKWDFLLRYVLPSTSEKLGQYNTKFLKKRCLTCLKKSCYLDGIVNRSISLKTFFKYFCEFGAWLFLFQVNVTFQSSNSTLQKIWNNFCCIVFLFASAQKACLGFLKFCLTNWKW